jgi:hypothetical protein
MGLSFTIALALSSAFILEIESLGTLLYNHFAWIEQKTPFTTITLLL